VVVAPLLAEFGAVAARLAVVVALIAFLARVDDAITAAVDCYVLAVCRAGGARRTVDRTEVAFLAWVHDAVAAAANCHVLTLRRAGRARRAVEGTEVAFLAEREDTVTADTACTVLGTRGLGSSVLFPVVAFLARLYDAVAAAADCHVFAVCRAGRAGRAVEGTEVAFLVEGKDAVTTDAACAVLGALGLGSSVLFPVVALLARLYYAVAAAANRHVLAVRRARGAGRAVEGSKVAFFAERHDPIATSTASTVDKAIRLGCAVQGTVIALFLWIDEAVTADMWVAVWVVWMAVAEVIMVPVLVIPRQGNHCFQEKKEGKK
jgi:hypothetical protein